MYPSDCAIRGALGLLAGGALIVSLQAPFGLVSQLPVVLDIRWLGSCPPDPFGTGPTQLQGCFQHL